MALQYVKEVKLEEVETEKFREALKQLFERKVEELVIPLTTRRKVEIRGGKHIYTLWKYFNRKGKLESFYACVGGAYMISSDRTAMFVTGDPQSPCIPMIGEFTLDTVKKWSEPVLLHQDYEREVVKIRRTFEGVVVEKKNEYASRRVEDCVVPRLQTLKEKITVDRRGIDVVREGVELIGGDRTSDTVIFENGKVTVKNDTVELWCETDGVKGDPEYKSGYGADSMVDYVLKINPDKISIYFRHGESKTEGLLVAENSREKVKVFLAPRVL